MSLIELTNELYAEVDASDLSIDADAFAYLGFNPEKVAELLGKIETNRSQLLKDLVHLILFATIRGTNFAKAVIKMDEKGAKLIASLVQKYKIKRNAGEASFSDLTLTRLTAAFPGITLKVRIKLGDKCPVVGTLPSKMPKWFAFPSAPACIPKTDESRYALWLEWANSFAVIINSPTDPNVYGRIALNSTVTTDAQRAGMVKQWN